MYYIMFYVIDMKKDELLEMGIIVSIKKEYTERIEKLIKNYEFRNYIPKRKFKYLIVHESGNGIKYIIEVGNIVKYPDKIDNSGYGNSKFNKGEGSQYAYFIKHLYKLNQVLPYQYLKSKYNFNPPQAFTYAKMYKNLVNEVKNAPKCKLK